MSSTVGLPAPCSERDVVEAERERAVERRACRRSARRRRARTRSRRSSSSRMILRKFLSQRTVMPYSATPPKPAITRSSSGSFSVADVADRLERHARRRRAATPDSGGGSGSILRPSMPTTVWPSFIRWCASVNPAGPMPTTSTRLPVRGARQRPAQVERIPARQQRVDLEPPRQREHVLQRSASPPAECRPARCFW